MKRDADEAYEYLFYELLPVSVPLRGDEVFNIWSWSIYCCILLVSVPLRGDEVFNVSLS